MCRPLCREKVQDLRLKDESLTADEPPLRPAVVEPAGVPIEDEEHAQDSAHTRAQEHQLRACSALLRRTVVRI